MGKRSRRARAKHRAGDKSTKKVQVQRVSAAEPEVGFRAAAPFIKPVVTSGWETRYQYILPELRRIGIIAGVLFFVLFVLAFILS